MSVSDLEGLELCEVCGLVESEHNDGSPYKTHVFRLKPPVCRWTVASGGRYQGCAEASGNRLRRSALMGYRYCPYCGRKIEEAK